MPAAEQLPRTAALSSAYLTDDVTLKEYAEELPVAAAQEARKLPIYETTWSEVKPKDVALIAWPNGKSIAVMKATVEDARPAPRVPGDLTRWIVVRFAVDGLPYSKSFNADEMTFVQSRF